MSNSYGVATDEIPQLKIGAGAASSMVRVLGAISLNITPASVGAATTSSQNFALLGTLPGDIIYVTPPSTLAGVAPVCARVNAADSVTIVFMNATAGALVPPAGRYQVMVMR